MARNTKAKGKIVRRLGVNIYGNSKYDKLLKKKPQGPGQERGKRKAGKLGDFGRQLLEKQKLRYAYGLSEKQFYNTFLKAKRKPGLTGDNMMILLERRLDNVVYRLGFADSRAQARQIVQHGHIQVNGRKTDIPSYQTKEGDTISWRESSKKTEYYKQLLEDIGSKTLVSWLSLDRQRLIGQIISLPTLDEVGAEFDGQAVVEYYSR